MTLEGMKVILAGRLGQRTDIDDMIYNEIRQAQRVLEKTPPYPWFLQVSALREYDLGSSLLPDDFIEMFEDVIYIIKATTDVTYYSPMVKLHGSYLEHISNMAWGTAGRPRNFAISGKYLFLQPAPDISYTFVLGYYQRDAVLSGPASENLWSNKAEDLLIAEAGWHVARNIRDAQRASEFGQDRAEARRRIAAESTSRLESMRRAVIGSGEDALLLQPNWEIGHQ